MLLYRAYHLKINFIHLEKNLKFILKSDYKYYIDKIYNF